jgi:hypothetical protein
MMSNRCANALVKTCWSQTICIVSIRVPSPPSLQRPPGV